MAVLMKHRSSVSTVADTGQSQVPGPRSQGMATCSTFDRWKPGLPAEVERGYHGLYLL